MNALMPSAPVSPLVRAISTMNCATTPKLHHCLRPLMTYESPSRTARVFIALTSEPASDSEMAIAVTERPLAKIGR